MKGIDQMNNKVSFQSSNIVERRTGSLGNVVTIPKRVLGAIFATTFVWVVSACGASSTPGGLPSACKSSSDPYFNYAAAQIRQAGGELAIYNSGLDNGSKENSIANDFTSEWIRFSSESMRVWLSAHQECRTGAVEIFTSKLEKLDSAPFRQRNLKDLKELLALGNKASLTLGLSVTFDLDQPNAPTANGIPRPLDVMGTHKSFDSQVVYWGIEAGNSQQN